MSPQKNYRDYYTVDFLILLNPEFLPSSMGYHGQVRVPQPMTLMIQTAKGPSDSWTPIWTPKAKKPPYDAHKLLN